MHYLPGEEGGGGGGGLRSIGYKIICSISYPTVSRSEGLLGCAIKQKHKRNGPKGLQSNIIGSKSNHCIKSDVFPLVISRNIYA